MKLRVLGSVLVTGGFAFANPAHADPTPPPSPYQIQTPTGPTVGGLRSLPPVCASQPLACAGKWNIGAGTWDFPGTGSP
jgi:hypothetical protein